jgi:hypothetical protein
MFHMLYIFIYFSTFTALSLYTTLLISAVLSAER